MENFQAINPDVIKKHETHLISSIIAHLPQGIIICDTRGQIRLTNHQAKSILFLNQEKQDDGFIGKSISSILGYQLIDHALDEINQRLQKNVQAPASYFIFKKQDHIIHVKVTPVLDEVHQFKGVVLVLNDITRQSEIDQKTERILNSLAKDARSPIASIRAAIEAIREFPAMEPERQERFKNIIYDESLVLSSILNQVSDNYVSLVGTKENITFLPVVELMDTLVRRAYEKLEIVLNTEKIDKDIQIQADPYAMIMTLLFLLNQIKNFTGYALFFCSVTEKEGIVNMDFQWSGEPLSPEQVKAWEYQYPDISGQVFPMTVREALNIQHAELWPYEPDAEGSMPFLRIFIPGTTQKTSVSFNMVSALPEPFFDSYDPVLFDKSGLDPELDNRLLTELNYTSMIRKISQAQDLNDIMGKHSQLPRLIHSMITSGTKTGTITWLITRFSDAILDRLIRFAMDELGPSPVRFAFMTLGSEGRQEQTFKTDQDNAIVYEDIPEGSDLNPIHVQGYFLELGDLVCSWLDRAGYDFCLGGIMARNVKWCQPLSTWKSYFSKWVRTSEPEHLLHIAIFFDFRFSFGKKSLIDQLNEHLEHTIKDHPGALHFLARNALNFHPPLGFWGNFILEKNQKGQKRLDLKKAMTPIVDFARIYALKHNIRETNTKARLFQLYTKRILNRDTYTEMEQAYSFLLQVRLTRQIHAILGENQKADNEIHPGHLSTFEKKMLKEVFKHIRFFQSRLRQEFKTEA